MYVWSQQQPQAARQAVGALPAVTGPMMAKAAADMHREGWLVAAMKGPLTNTPYKVYAIEAPRQGASLAGFVAAALPVRLPRFLVMAAAFALIGRIVGARVSQRTVLWVFTGAWVLFYGWFWLSHRG